MANSLSHLDQLAPSQAAKESSINCLADAASPSMLYGRRASTCGLLTWGFYGGIFRAPDGALIPIVNGTIQLTENATNYLYATSGGVVTKATTEPEGWPDALAGDALALYEIVTGPATATSYTDWRTAATGGGTGGGTTDIAAEIVAATAKTTPADADLLALVDSAASNTLKKLTWANVKATLKSYLDTLYAPKSQPIVVSLFYPGVPSAGALIGVFTAPAGITTLTFAAAIAGSSGRSLVAATAQADIDVRRNATSSSGGTSVGTIRFAASGTVPTFIAASGFTLTGGTDYLSFWAPASADATLANIALSIHGARS